MTLKKFSNSELFISAEEAHKILVWFFGEVSLSPNSLTESDRAFAQALLLEGIDSSEPMGYVHDIFMKAMVPTSYSTIKSIAKAFVKRAVSNWWKKSSGKQLQDPQIYFTVKLAISRNFKSAWKIREQTGEPVIY